MLVTPEGMTMLSRYLQPLKASAPMLVSFSDRVMSWSFVFSAKAPSAMAVTGKSPISEGMTGLRFVPT